MGREFEPAELYARVMSATTIFVSIIIVPVFGSFIGKEYIAPIVVGCIVASLYSVLYSILFAEIRKMSEKNDAILQILQVGDTKVDMAVRSVEWCQSIDVSGVDADEKKPHNVAVSDKAERKPLLTEVVAFIGLVSVLIGLFTTAYILL